MAPAFKSLSILAVLFLNLSITSAQGTQFITGPCKTDVDCASGCCGFNSGLCAGPIIAQERDGGCGFGSAQPNDNAARLLRGGAAATTLVIVTSPVPIPNPSASPAQNNSATPILEVPTAATSVVVAAGTHFITGPCAGDADCASGCCGFTSGKCAGPVVAQERDGGCGFGNAAPNDNAARKLVGKRSWFF